ncbi:uncharacterized protein LOC134538377 [Bacillus rossius redtenbacheri]|uniref:uncharacterized protein LOC134538377 n=1 Tax=Bacillus rossius redtenbacheri TaxID=93214 RepID=UPI002FDEE54C
MTDLLVQSNSGLGDTFSQTLLDGCRSGIVHRYGRSENLNSGCLKHSKSDDLVLQSNVVPSERHHHARCDSPVPKTSSVVYEDDLVSSPVPHKAKYFSDSETDNNTRPSLLDVTGRKHPSELPEVHRSSSKYVGLYDRVDPEDSIRDMITENDFYRFVLFKRHYDKYLHLSQKYEEARNIAYYLEEKYHEIKSEKDSLGLARLELERKLESKELELHEKEEELFLQLEKVVRLEEDCEKLRAEKEKFALWKEKLEKQKNEAYRQLRLQASQSEAARRGLERARQEAVRQVTSVSAEKDQLQQENEQLKETLCEERRGVGHYVVDLSRQKKRLSQNMVGLEKEVSDLKFINCQSASLNNQFKKGMKHLATCRRKKCSVCSYTRATFGEYRNDKKLLSCFQAPFQDLRNWMKPLPSPGDDEQQKEGGGRYSSASGCSVYPAHSSPLPSTRSEYSLRRPCYSSAPGSPSPSPSSSCHAAPFMSYIDDDDDSTSSESSRDSGHVDELDGPPCHCPYGPASVPTDTSVASTSSCSAAAAPHAFSSDSGFSSELSRGSRSPAPALQRSRWTASFRKLISKVSKR